MQYRSEGFYSVIIPGRMDAIGEQNHRRIPVKIHPERCTGEPQMSYGPFWKKPAAARVDRRRRIEPQRTACAFILLQKAPG